MWICTNRKYDNTGEPYADVDAFQRMCVAVFGERADIYELDGVWFDRDDGLPVLRPTEPEQGHDPRDF